MTISEFEELDNDNKYELVNGELKMMSASGFHELLVSLLNTEFGIYLKGKQCRVHSSHQGIKINDLTVRYPDLSIICDRSKYYQGMVIYEGIPELVIEILSPGNNRKDMSDKKTEYLSLKIKEYWVVINEYKVEVNLYNKESDKYDSFIIYSTDNNLFIPVHLPNWNLVIDIDFNEIPKELRNPDIYLKSDYDGRDEESVEYMDGKYIVTQSSDTLARIINNFKEKVI